MIITEQEKTLRIGNLAIPYHLRKGKPHRIKISFSEDLILNIETGNGRLGSFERNFLESKQKWILKIFQEREKAASQKQALLNGLEKEVPIFGELVPIEYTPYEKTFYKYIHGASFSIHAPAVHILSHKKELLFFALKEFAARFLQKKVDHWSEQTKLDYNRLRVKDLKSKWGSCSTLRNINLNWQLIFLEEELIDYVIVHEFMHLREMNHSPRFWAWVGEYCPDYKRLKKTLKEKSWLVGILK